MEPFEIYWAVQFLEKATELEPDDPEIIDHLGDALWQSGRQIEARYQWRRALALEDDTTKQKQIEDKIKGEVSQIDAYKNNKYQMIFNCQKLVIQNSKRFTVQYERVVEILFQ